jgi:hypothetical protein
MPAEDDEVGAGGQAGEDLARMAMDDVFAELYVRVLLTPAGQHLSELAA